MKNLLVQTKFYWSWAGGPVPIVRTVFFMSFDFITPKHVLNYLVFQCFGFERIDQMKVILKTWTLN